MGDEKCIFNASAVVYYFNSSTKSWGASPVGNEFCQVAMYEHTKKGTFRVIARGSTNTSEVVINSNVAPTTKYTRASDTFHQWADNRYIYGLNFAKREGAETFGKGFDGVVARLNGSGGSAAKAAPKPPAAPAAPKPPAAPAAPKPPSAPGPPPAPAPGAKPAGGGAGRGALLNSIQGFKKGGLKKAETVDKSAPVVGKSGGGGGSSGGSSGGGGAPGGGGMMGAILAQRANMMKPGSGGLKPASGPKVGGGVPKPSGGPVGAPKFPGGAPKLAVNNRDRAPSSGPKFGGNNRDRAPSVGSGSGGGNSGLDLNALKAEIMTEVRKEIESVKAEIIAAIAESS